MSRSSVVALALVLGAAWGGACKQKAGGEDGARGEGPTDLDTSAPVVTAAATATASAAPAEGADEGEGATDSGDDPMDDPETAEAAKNFDCGAKDQEMCPMQKWMKTVMAKANQSGDPQKLAAALREVAQKPVEGYDEWVTIATEGAAAAAKGDIRAAKQSCKDCHKLYKKKYISTLRDQPW